MSPFETTLSARISHALSLPAEEIRRSLHIHIDLPELGDTHCDVTIMLSVPQQGSMPRNAMGSASDLRPHDLRNLAIAFAQLQDQPIDSDGHQRGIGGGGGNGGGTIH